MKILIRNFYVRLSIPNRNMLDYAAKGNFIENDVIKDYEMLEGIVGVPPTMKASPFTQEGIQILEKLSDMQKNLIELSKNGELSKTLNSNLQRMSSHLITCNKKLENIDKRFVDFENLRNSMSLPLDPNVEINGKRKEPPGFERNIPLKKVAKEPLDDKT